VSSKRYVILSGAAQRAAKSKNPFYSVHFKGGWILRLATLAQDDTLLSCGVNRVNYNLPFQLLFDIFPRQRYNIPNVSDLGRTGKDGFWQRLQKAVSTEGGRIAVVK
jgi:hypothetical protein